MQGTFHLSFEALSSVIYLVDEVILLEILALMQETMHVSCSLKL